MNEWQELLATLAAWRRNPSQLADADHVKPKRKTLDLAVKVLEEIRRRGTWRVPRVVLSCNGDICFEWFYQSLISYEAIRVGHDGNVEHFEACKGVIRSRPFEMKQPEPRTPPT